MSSSSKNQIDSSVAERRLRPIYDCLDCGNNKRALQEADKLLRKQPSFQCAKALKCLALLRMGKEKDCEELIKTLHDEVPYNEATLQAMSICYRELHKPELICSLYAAAAEKHPASEDLLTQLFMSYVRVGDYKKQQSVAMALYKLLPKNPYYFWAVMSIVMQARTTNPELKSSIVLPLAERMVDKFIKQDKIEAEQEVQLYLMILEMQGKLEESLAVIEGPLGEKLQSFVIPNKRVELLIKLKRWREVNVVLKRMLREEMDCWSFYKDYLKSVFELIEVEGEKKGEEGEKMKIDKGEEKGKKKEGAMENGGEKVLEVEGKDQKKTVEKGEEEKKMGKKVGEMANGGEEVLKEKGKDQKIDGKEERKEGSGEKGKGNVEEDKNEGNGEKEVKKEEEDSERSVKKEGDKVGEGDKKQSNGNDLNINEEDKIKEGSDKGEEAKNGEEKKKVEEEEEKPDTSLSDCAAFLSNIQEENQRASHRLRGPYLAQLEFYSMLKKHGKEDEVHLVGDLVELFMLYFHEFGGKQCCMGDLKPYLKMLSSEQAQDFLNQVFKMVQLEEGSLPSTLQQMLRYISNLQLSRCLGYHEVIDFNSKLKMATSLLHCYKESLHFNQGQLSTDIMNNDPYALMTAHILYDIWIETKDAIFLKDACVVLEFALSYSVSNYQIKLLLMKLYNMLGASREAFKVYELLDIKHMQLDTLGYLHLWPMLSTAQYSQAVQIFNTTLKFFTASNRESADHLTLSYKFGSFLKIGEFVEFRDRINNSLHYAFVQVEKTLIEVMQATSHDHTAQMVEQSIVGENIDWDRLEDNRDFSILWSANPPERDFPKDLIEVSFKTEKDLLRLRTLLLKLLSGAVTLSAVKSSNSKSEDNKSCSRSENREEVRTKLVKNLSELNQLYERLKKNPHTKLPLNIIEAPPESRLHDYISSQLVPLLMNLTRTVLGVDFSDKRNVINGNLLNGEEIERLNLEDFSDYAGKSVKCLEEATEEVAKFAKSNFGVGVNENSLNERLETIQRVTLVVELVCVSTVFCGVVFELVKEVMAPVVGRKGKKKKENVGTPVPINDPDQKKRTDCFETLVASTRKAIKLMNETVDHLKSAWHPSLTNVVTKVDLLEFKHPFCQFLNESYMSSLYELNSILRRKLRHVDELKL